MLDERVGIDLVDAMLQPHIHMYIYTVLPRERGVSVHCTSLFLHVTCTNLHDIPSYFRLCLTSTFCIIILFNLIDGMFHAILPQLFVQKPLMFGLGSLS